MLPASVSRKYASNSNIRPPHPTRLFSVSLLTAKWTHGVHTVFFSQTQTGSLWKRKLPLLVKCTCHIPAFSLPRHRRYLSLPLPLSLSLFCRFHLFLQTTSLSTCALCQQSSKLQATVNSVNSRHSLFLCLLSPFVGAAVNVLSVACAAVPLHLYCMSHH